MAAPEGRGARARLRAVPRDWRLKAAVQSGLSLLPGAPRLVDRARRTRKPFLSDTYVLGKWVHVQRHARAATRLDGGLAGRHVLDLGTGWFPVVPLGLRLVGAGRVGTIDVVDHLDGPCLRLTVQRLVELADAGRIEVVDTDQLERMRAVLRRDGPLDPTRTLADLGISAHNGDARRLEGMPGAVGAAMLVSNNTLEHIEPTVIGAILAEFHRVGAADAVMHHHIDLADHYAQHDPRINDYHFLRYSDRRWRVANNALLYQNRLRASEYERLLTEAGWAVVARREHRRDPAELRAVTVHPRFAGYDEQDLLVIRTGLTAVRR